MAYVNPQTCPKCPHRHSKLGCPAWVGAENTIMETNLQTGDIRAVVGCFYQVLPKLMVHVIQASNRPAAVLQEMRNDMTQGLGQIAQAVQQMMPRLQEEAHLQLEHKDGEGK